MNRKSIGEYLFITASLFSIVFLGFILGIAMMEFKFWPYPLFKDAYNAAKAWNERLTPRSRYNTSLYHHTTYTEIGVLQYNQEKAYNGLTLFTSGHAHQAFLLSMRGQIVHEWHLPFSQVGWNHIEFPLTDDFIWWRKIYLYPNGDLLAIYEAEGDTPFGYGLIKIDKDSHLIWKYAERVHHDVDVGNDDKIYTLIHNIVTTKIPGLKVDPPFLEDSIVILSPEGQELKRVSISKIFINSDFSNFEFVPVSPIKGDLWHTNNVEILNEQVVAQFPTLKKGEILVSLKHIDSVAVVDLNKEQIVSIIRGEWRGQHDPDFLPNGNILLFDNLGHYGKGGGSQIIEVNPISREIVWRYAGNEKDIFFSKIRSSQQRLPNGNTLITSSDQGRIFEVTPEQEIVWEFINPFRSPHDNQLTAVVCWGQRFKPSSLHFEFNRINQN